MKKLYYTVYLIHEIHVDKDPKDKISEHWTGEYEIKINTLK